MGVCAFLWLSAAGLFAQSNVTLQLVGRWTNNPASYAKAIKVSDGIVYLGYDTLEIVDVRDPSKPAWLASYRPAEGGYLNGIDVAGGVALIALSSDSTGAGGLHALDVSDPAQPRRLGHNGTPTNATGVRIQGEYALVADSHTGLHILDFRNPVALPIVGHCPSVYNPLAVDAAEGRVYLRGQWTLEVFDVTDIANPQARGSYADYSGYAWDVKVVGTSAFLARGGIEVLDVSDPNDLVRVTEIPEEGVSGLAVLGQNLYLAAGQSGLLVYDIGNPSQPVPAGQSRTLSPAQRLDLADGYAFVVGVQGLEIYRLGTAAIGIARQPLSQVFTNNGQALVLEAHGGSIAPLTYQWSKDGWPLANDGRINGADRPMLMIEDVTPDDAGTYSLIVSNEYGTAISQGAVVTYYAGLGEALDDQRLRWSGGWLWQTNVTHDGIDAAQSPALRSGIVAAMSWVSVRVTGPGHLSFWWRATADSDLWTGADFVFGLYIGGQRRAATSEEPFRDTGPDQWREVVVDVGEGEQEIRWLFSTLGGCTDPAIGTAWLDEVVFTPSYASIRSILRAANNGYRLECEGPPGMRLILQRSADLISWEDLPGSTELVPADGRVAFEAPGNETGRGFYRLRIVGQ